MKKVLKCPKCGGEMSFQGYRPLFPECVECGETSFIGKCISVENKELDD